MPDVDHGPPDPPRVRDGHRFASDQVWAAARADYLSGWSGPAVCGRHGLGLSAFRARARDEGWRRIDQPDDVWPDDDIDDDADDSPLPTTGEFVDAATRRFARALKSGRVLEADRWLRIRDRLQAGMEAEHRAHQATDRRDLADTTRSLRDIESQSRAILAAARMVAQVDGLHDLHGVQDAAADRPLDRPPNRAERRRQLKERPG